MIGLIMSWDGKFGMLHLKSDIGLFGREIDMFDVLDYDGVVMICRITWLCPKRRMAGSTIYCIGSSIPRIGIWWGYF
jgi:hypothetical protein